MIKQLTKKILDIIAIPAYQYCYDRLKLRQVVCTNYISSPSPSQSISPVATPHYYSSFYAFCEKQNNIVIFGNSLKAMYASEILLLSKDCIKRNIFKGYIIVDEEKHYLEYCEYPIWNISDFPLQVNDIGIIIACPHSQQSIAVSILVKRGFFLENIYIFEEPCRPLNENMLNNALTLVRDSNLRVIIHGANREGAELHNYLRERDIPVLYFISDIPFSGAFNGLPLRSMYDLIFENVEDKFVFVAGRYPSGVAYEMRWDKQSAFLSALNIQHHTLLSHRGLYVDSNVNANVHLDANLGSNHYRGEKQGLRIWGNWDAPHAIKVAILGGSTSDPFFADYSELYTPWSEMLYEHLQPCIPNIAIACGGIESYISSQELLKLIRDIIPLKPDLVISFSIVNDLFQYFTYKNERDGADEKNNHYKRPFLSLTAERFYRFAYENAELHKLIEDVRPICFGIRDKRNVVEFWIDIMRMMYTLGQEFNFEFLGILQPNAVTYADGTMKSFYILESLTYTLRQEAYNLARQAIRKYPFLLDYTDIYNDLDENPYMDGFHVQPHGNRTIVERVHQDILRLGLLQGRLTA
jgi:hypothetical protein